MAVVALGGLLGAPARYALSLALPGPSSAWPTATFVTNLSGALLLGVLLEALVRAGPDTGGRRVARLGLGTGVLGAFTTYSTFAVEVDDLLSAGRAGTAVAYALVSVLGGLLAAAAGIGLGSLVRGRRSRVAPSPGRPG